VLISPHSIGGVDKARVRSRFKLTKTEIEHRPVVEQRQASVETIRAGIRVFFRFADVLGLSARAGAKAESGERRESTTIPICVALMEVSGIMWKPQRGEIGHVEDFLIDDQTWAIRYLIVDTKDWLPGKKVLIFSEKWIERVSWSEKAVVVALTREAIQQAPEYTDSPPLTETRRSPLSTLPPPGLLASRGCGRRQRGIGRRTPAESLA